MNILKRILCKSLITGNEGLLGGLLGGLIGGLLGGDLMAQQSTSANTHLTQETQVDYTINQTVPNFFLHQILNHTTNSTNLLSFGAELYILDFWDTYCAPCVAAMPKYDSLQRYFKGRVQIIPVTRSDRDKISSFIAKRWPGNMLKLPFVVNDTTLHNAFPHTTVPHEVWINSKGKVRAITTGERVTASNIERMLNDSSFTLKTKELNYKPLGYSILDNLSDYSDEIIHQSTLTRRINHVLNTSGRGKVEGSSNKYRVHSYNATILKLYQMALDKVIPDNQIIFENVVDKTPYFTNKSDADEYENWAEKHTYCYELIFTMPDSVDRKGQRKLGLALMFNDLNRYFGNLYRIQAALERRTVPCLVVKAKRDHISTESSGEQKRIIEGDKQYFQNFPITSLVDYISRRFDNDISTPIITDPGTNGTIDIVLTKDELSDISLLEGALNRYGLNLVKENKEIEVLVIRGENLLKEFK